MATADDVQAQTKKALDYLKQRVDGTVKTINGNAPDSSGNIAPSQTGCLPLSGGLMTGEVATTWPIFMRRDRNDSYLIAIGGATYNNAGHVALFGKDANDPRAGGFELRASNGSSFCDLLGTPNGQLTWKGDPVMNPTGTVIAFAANSAPAGYLLCNGSAVSRTTYAKLFAAIGTTYGSGDGSTTFNLPNLIGRFIQGTDNSGVYIEAGLPEIWGTFNLQNDKFIGQTGAFVQGAQNTRYTNGIQPGGTGTGGLAFNASACNGIYGNSTTVQPPAIQMRYYIKY